MKGILKWPLIIAAVVVILRVANERAGGSPILSSALSVVALHTLLAPVYFAIRIAGSGAERPYATLLKLILSYAVWTRAMLLPVYWLARVYQWPEQRFDGLWGPRSNAFVGFIAVPFLTAFFLDRRLRSGRRGHWRGRACRHEFTVEAGRRHLALTRETSGLAPISMRYSSFAFEENDERRTIR